MAAPPVQDARTDLPPVALDPKQVVNNRTPRRMRPMHKVLIVWLVLMAVIFGVAKWSTSGDDTRPVADEGPRKAAKPEDVDPNQQFIDESLPACRELLTRFLSSAGIESRLPLVLPHPEIAERMEGYYADNQLLKVQPENLILKAGTLVDLPEGETILTQWETPEGASFDAAFRQVGVEWRLDWHHFVRYSDLSWSLFVAGSGDSDIAEFRLYARPRLASEDDPPNGIGVVLSAPLRRQMDAEGFSQSMVGLSLNEEDGQLLDKAFKREAAGFPILGARFPDLNPEGMIRVRVKVQRLSDEGGNRYRITDVLACHWYDSAAVGLE